MHLKQRFKIGEAKTNKLARRNRQNHNCGQRFNSPSQQIIEQVDKTSVKI